MPLSQRLDSSLHASWSIFCDKMAQGEWGDELTLIAIAELFKVRIQILSTLGNTIHILPQHNTAQRTIHLLHQHEHHYRSIEKH